LKEDWVELTKLLLAMDDDESKSMLVEAASNDIEAFALSFAYLRKHAANGILGMRFVTPVLGLDFQEQTESVVGLLKLAFERNSEDRVKILELVMDKMTMRARLVIGLVENGLVRDEDVKSLVGCIRVLKGLEIPVREELADLARAVAGAGEDAGEAVAVLRELLSDLFF
jgi:hypothetical protein